MGEFSNLESLVLLQVLDHPILQRINHTTTSKLRILDLRQSAPCNEDVDHLCGAVLKRATSLVLHSTRLNSLYLHIPTKVVTIQDEYRNTHLFPHVRTYILTDGEFWADSETDLQRLTTLIITRSLILEATCNLILPSLRRFVCAGITLGSGAVLDAPLLESLEFRNPERYTNEQSGGFVHGPSYVAQVLAHPGFLLSPSNSLSLQPPLPSGFSQMTLTRHTRLQKLELNLGSDDAFWAVIAALTEGVREGGFACPQLTELKLKFEPKYRDYHEFAWWRDAVAQIAEERRGFAAIPRVYGPWDEGGTFMLLA
jgi:hypothetical protein